MDCRAGSAPERQSRTYAMNDRILSCKKAENNGDEYVVEFRSSGPVRFTIDEVMEHGLYDDSLVPDLDALLGAVLETRMKRFILPYCVYARRTERQIADRLFERFSVKNGYDGIWAPRIENAVDNVVSYLIAQGYAGDNVYCVAYIKSCADKNVSGNYIAAELVKRGVERRTANAAVAAAGLDETGACRRALAKKAGNMTIGKDENGRVPEKVRAALVRFLLSRGFETGLAVDTVDDYIGEMRD